MVPPNFDYRVNHAYATNLVQNFVNHPVLGAIAQNYALGGTISLSAFQSQHNNAPLYTGKMGWFCWNPNSILGLPGFFLAFEQNNHYMGSAETAMPENSELSRPNQIFTFSSQNVGTLLRSQNMPLPNPANSLISKNDVINLKTVFSTSFPRSGLTGFNKFPYSFFESFASQSFHNLITQSPTVKYIRYYFGYDESEDVNQIRVILIGVDKDGANIMQSGGNEVILQKCWPPPYL